MAEEEPSIKERIKKPKVSEKAFVVSGQLLEEREKKKKNASEEIP